MPPGMEILAHHRNIARLVLKLVERPKVMARWRRKEVRKWKKDDDSLRGKRGYPGLDLIPLPEKLSLAEKFAILATLHDRVFHGERRIEQIDPWKWPEHDGKITKREYQTIVRPGIPYGVLCSRCLELPKTDESKLLHFLAEVRGELSALLGREKPTWNRATGELRHNNLVIKSIDHIGRAKNVVAILDQFQDEEWPNRIIDPMPGVKNDERLRDAIKSLNKGLQEIVFRADGTGMGILWNER